MNAVVEREDRATIVAVAGDVDAGSAPDLRRLLDDLLVQGDHNFVVDLTGVEFMDSSGMATLVQLFKRVRVGEGDVRLCGLQPKVRRVFELIRLDRVFDSFPTRKEAIASFEPSDRR